MANETNVFGKPLMLCCGNSGFTREGFCAVPPADFGNHSICAIVDEPFLTFSARRGNDLMSPRPDMMFPGLAPGDRWCLCAARWWEAHQAGVAPKVVLAATHKKALDVVPLSVLKAYATEPA
ncbi:DUF2237 family protein [Salinimonas chungwhensis]|uniref:DUF2237 family protein n=1 Tax=Salinimonas chungwhensis TaxID=265425 RepID=UPI000368758D|nr:DUF2237 domain-containing protein [Salinimonas chungwhensis]